MHYHQKNKEQFSDKYYGEVEFKLHYNGEEEVFSWLYADEQLLMEAAAANQMKYELLYRNKSDAFLVR